MRYSLESRFQGALLGSIIGYTIATISQNQKPDLAVSLRITHQLIDSLILHGDLKIGVWQQIYTSQCQQKEPENGYYSSELALAFLPLILLFHDNPDLLREKIAALTTSCPDSPTASLEIYLWAEVISLALREKLDLDYLNCNLTVDTQTPPKESLSRQEHSYHSQNDSESALDQLSRAENKDRTPLKSALYYFTTTAEDFALSVLRALQTSDRPRITAALTGALAGAYNSYLSIPHNWRMLTKKDKIAVDIYLKARHLFALWCGVYDPQTDMLPSEIAISSPRVIQPRFQASN